MKKRKIKEKAREQAFERLKEGVVPSVLEYGSVNRYIRARRGHHHPTVCTTPGDEKLILAMPARTVKLEYVDMPNQGEAVELEAEEAEEGAGEQNFELLENEQNNEEKKCLAVILLDHDDAAIHMNNDSENDDMDDEALHFHQHHREQRQGNGFGGLGLDLDIAIDDLDGGGDDMSRNVFAAHAYLIMDRPAIDRVRGADDEEDADDDFDYAVVGNESERLRVRATWRRRVLAVLLAVDALLAVLLFVSDWFGDHASMASLAALYGIEGSGGGGMTLAVTLVTLVADAVGVFAGVMRTDQLRLLNLFVVAEALLFVVNCLFVSTYVALIRIPFQIAIIFTATRIRSSRKSHWFAIIRS
jgi:hypothetical protein